MQIAYALGQPEFLADGILGEIRQIRRADLLAPDLVGECHCIDQEGGVDSPVLRNVAVAVAVKLLACPVTKIGIACLRAKRNALAERGRQRCPFIEGIMLDLREQILFSP